MSRTLAEVGFGDGRTYEQGRPGYPDEALRFFAEQFDLKAGVRVLDLGAGTGKFTRHLLAYGVDVVAVEPSESMRAELARSLPNVDARAGTGESIPFAAASFDVVFVAQAFHWFDPARALAEIARVLRPGGGLGLIWNERDESVDWVHRLSEVMLWHERQPYKVGTDFRPVMESTGKFGSVERRAFRHTQRVDRRVLRERVASTSYIVAMSSSEREVLLGRVDEFIATLPEPIDLPYVTDVYAGHRL